MAFYHWCVITWTASSGVIMSSTLLPDLIEVLEKELNLPHTVNTAVFLFLTLLKLAPMDQMSILGLTDYLPPKDIIAIYSVPRPGTKSTYTSLRQTVFVHQTLDLMQFCSINLDDIAIVLLRSLHLTT
jgi:hypothetical protein